MANDLLQNKDFLQACRKATLSAFKNKIDDAKLNSLLEHMPSPAAGPAKNVLRVSGGSGAIQAEASIVSAVIYAKVKCYPDNKPWKFEESAWGPGIGGGECIGFMYTAYTGDNAWETFFKDATAYHAQGIAEAGGIFQINWFRSDGTPIGQFNGALGGAGVFEIGGSGKWKKK